jgi:arylsulfatase B
MDGVDLLACLSGQDTRPPHDALYWRMGRKTALRKGDWKIVRNPRRRSGEPAFELYHLASDVSETTDLAERRGAKLRELQAAWDTFNNEMVSPVWTPK